MRVLFVFEGGGVVKSDFRRGVLPLSLELSSTLPVLSALDGGVALGVLSASLDVTSSLASSEVLP